MVCPELGDEVGRVLCGVDGEGFGDGEESRGEFANGELFAGALVTESIKDVLDRTKRIWGGGAGSLTKVVAKFSR